VKWNPKKKPLFRLQCLIFRHLYIYFIQQFPVLDIVNQLWDDLIDKIKQSLALWIIPSGDEKGIGKQMNVKYNRV